MNSTDCIRELSEVCDKVLLPMLVYVDFNLILEIKDKSSDLCSQNLMDLFNGFIGRSQLREIIRVGLKYTWTLFWLA